MVVYMTQFEKEMINKRAESGSKHYYTEYIASWIEAGGEVWGIKPFEWWLQEEGLDDEDIMNICALTRHNDNLLSSAHNYLVKEGLIDD